ncbi:hypothetical protein EJB05_21078, partial [Eragrostis curvula]
NRDRRENERGSTRNLLRSSASHAFYLRGLPPRFGILFPAPNSPARWAPCDRSPVTAPPSPSTHLVRRTPPLAPLLSPLEEEEGGENSGALPNRGQPHLIAVKKMVEDTSSSPDTAELSGHVAHKNVFYDKDIVEIKLADTIDSDKYGGYFVKDVCIDEGTLFHQKISEEKQIDRRSSPNFGCQMTEANNELIYWKKDDASKPEAIVPVDLSPGCRNEKQYSTGKEYDDHDGGISTDYIAGDPGEKKISLQELLLLESAEESRLASTTKCESGEKQNHLHEESVSQVYINDTHEIQAVVPETNEHVSSDASSMMSKDHGAALDVKKPNQIDRHNPFIDHRSMVVEDALEPQCSVPTITDDAFTEPVYTGSKTDSFSSVVSGSTGLNEVRTADSGVDAAISSNSDIQSSEKSEDDCENLASKAIVVVDEAAVIASSSPNNVEPSDLNGENQEKCDFDSVPDVHDFNQIVEEDGTDLDNAVRNSSTLAHAGSAVMQTLSEGPKSASRTSNDDPYEWNFFGPSIMSAPVSNSGHIAYSGNISLRSDSSTTSTRSFAFPVLQREWISSPVRMAKAERRHVRRRLGWRKGLICCKF